MAYLLAIERGEKLANFVKQVTAGFKEHYIYHQIIQNIVRF
jgi:hypothetical protein